MSRTADYTIQGFLYQFNKTALEVLKAQDDDTITVEGIVEDIEIASLGSLTAIQCKYHEASTSFTASAIYKPLLQMLKHFSENQTANIRYVLFAHFPTIGKIPPVVDKTTLEAALLSTDKNLAKHVKAVPSGIDLASFVSRFSMDFGPSYEDIAKQVGKELEANAIPKDDIETLAYPNAINIIATLSVKHDPAERNITKKQFLSDLMAIRTTAISRWTLALKSREKLLQARRKQLKVHLDKNARLRYFVIEPKSIEDYDNEIVLFVTDFIGKYHFKTAHTNTPILCICANREHVLEIQRRLFAKKVIADDGYIGGEFKESRFFRDPMFVKKPGGKIEREFAIRLLSWGDHGEVLNVRKCDDLFIIGEPNCDTLDTVDVNVERMAGATMKEIKYVMGVSNVYE
ncbi:MAG: hypothetical protein RBS57_07745 [Desulforhabdus sp.]|jgi:hypothetical protein|nr:hypothetical protein [Desulforhabdus sp.]